MHRVFCGLKADRRTCLFRLLNCYLERDLLLNGGRLAEVVFVVHTEDKEVRNGLLLGCVLLSQRHPAQQSPHCMHSSILQPEQCFERSPASHHSSLALAITAAFHACWIHRGCLRMAEALV